jgi:hypothetical protein
MFENDIMKPTVLYNEIFFKTQNNGKVCLGRILKRWSRENVIKRLEGTQGTSAANHDK